MIGSLILGVMIGGAAMYFYGRQISEYVESSTRGARSKAADTLHSAAEGMQSAKDRAESSIESLRSEAERRVG